MKIKHVFTKKEIIISSIILLLSVASIITTLIVLENINNPYHVKVAKFPINLKKYKIKEDTKNIIVNSNDFQNMISEKTEFNNKNKDFKTRYDDDFFKNSFLYYTIRSNAYDGIIDGTPYIKLKRCYYSKEKNKVILEVTSISKIQYNSDLAYVNTTYDPRGYVIEFPRELFDKHNLDYDDFQIKYLNYSNENYFSNSFGSPNENVQDGVDKYIFE